MKLATVAILASMAPSVALADVPSLPPVSFQVGAGNAASYGPGSVVSSLCNTYGCSDATVSAVWASSEPLLTANVSTTVGRGPTIYVYDAVTFYFEILSSSPGVVPIDLSASATTTRTGSSSAGELDAGGLVNYRLLDLACVGYATGGCGSSQFSVADQYIGNFAANTAYPVTFRITGQMGGNYSTGTLTAQLDPALSIDPSAGAGYSLIFSPIPEPSAWALLLLGTGAIGATLCGRRRGGVSSTSAKTTVVSPGNFMS